MPRRSSRNSTTAKSSASKKRSTNGREQSDPPTRAKRQHHQTQEDTARNLTSDDIPTIVTSIFQSFAASRTSGNRTNSITNGGVQSQQLPRVQYHAATPASPVPTTPSHLGATMPTLTRPAPPTRPSPAMKTAKRTTHLSLDH